MTEAEYQTQKADLETQLVALEAEWASSQEFPKWVYHETEPAQIINTPEEEAALGPGWSTSPGGPIAEVPIAPEPPGPLPPETREGGGADHGRLKRSGRLS